MRLGLRFGHGPFRLYVPLVSTRRRSTYWEHPGCTIRHRREDTANACRIGR
jgi:hypothetical protein